MTEQQPLSTQARFALRRLYKDWKELEQENDAMPNIRALPTSDIFVWHCNLRPDCGPFAGIVFHLVLNFPEDYPHSPPDVELCSYLSHPNVFCYFEGFYICLDMIQPFYKSEPYVGWTSAYSLVSILLQLQSFLFAENIPQKNGNTEHARRSKASLGKAIAAAKNFWYEVEAYDGTWVKHTHSSPWPPLPVYNGPPTPNPTQIPKDSKINLLWRPKERPSGTLSNQPFTYKPRDFPALTSGPSVDGQQTAVCRPIPMSETENLPTPIPKAENNRMAVHQTTMAARTLPPKKPQICTSTIAKLLPSEIFTSIFSFLDAKGLIRARDVCTQWRQIVVTYNLFERSQIQCFHSKVTLEDENSILGVGLKVEYYPDGKTLKSATSPLDLLSQEAFDEEGVRTGVWGGAAESFDHFLPLILNHGHASRAITRMEQTIHGIMKQCVLPCYDPKQNRQPKRPPETLMEGPIDRMPIMAFHLLATLMNSMVVELMNFVEPSPRRGRGVAETPPEIHRYASEKALEGYCAFHHMLLYFAKRYPRIIEFANHQIDQFLASEYFRHKRKTPNLGVLLICLTLSHRGWKTLRRPLVMEVFDRNVRWLLQKHPSLRLSSSLRPGERLELTFSGARTSLRLLMFQIYFLSRIGRPAGMKGPFDVLDCYEKQMGKPTASQKEDLQKNAREILAVTSRPQFFARLGGPVPESQRLLQILKQAIENSARKKYHHV